MELRLILYNGDKERERFELMRGVRPWDVLLAIKRGSFELLFPALGEEYIIGENEIAFIPSGTEFIRTVREPIDFHQFAFFCDPAEPLCACLSRGRLNLPKERAAFIIEALDRASEMTDNGELILHGLRSIITENYLFGESREMSPRSVGGDILEVIRYMSENLGNEICIDELAARVFLSHTGLISKFKRQVGTTPSKYLIMLRQRRAKQLLLDGDLKINEIAEACGYKNAYYFTNAFRAYTGMSPTDFRKFYLKGNDR